MKVRVNEDKGPIAGYYGVRNSGEVFTVNAGVGKDLVEANLVTEVGDDDDAKPEPKQGPNMTRNGLKEEKQAAQRQTKEDKKASKTKEEEAAPATETAAPATDTTEETK